MMLAGVFVASLLASAFFVRFLSPFAVRIGLVDTPGGRKQHKSLVPLVGGIAIYVSLLLAWGLLPAVGAGHISGAVIVATGLLMIIGIIDDRVQLPVVLRFGVQTLAVLVVISGDRTVLDDLGHLVSNHLVLLGAFAVPMTVFSTLGTINALNMIDGIDGLAGSLAFVSLSLLLVVAIAGGDSAKALMIICLLGAVSGFLLFNMPWTGRRSARVFLGDAGSTLLGFIFACLFIDMSQGPDRLIAPVTALWLLAVPLMDTVGVMLRRLWMKQSPFRADRNHLHHLLLAADFRVRQVALILAGLQLLLGMLGLVALRQGVPEWLMFYGFLGLFAVYFLLLSRPWRVVPRLRQLHGRLGLAAAGAREVYVGGLDSTDPAAAIAVLLAPEGRRYRLWVFERIDPVAGTRCAFAVVDAGSQTDLKALLRRLRRRQPAEGSYVIRQFIRRDAANDRRKVSNSRRGLERRGRDRRAPSVRRLELSASAGD